MPGVPELSPSEFAARWPDYAGSGEVVLLDVREHDELQAASVDGALTFRCVRFLPGSRNSMPTSRSW